MRKRVFNPSDDFQTANMMGMYNGVGAASSFALGVGLAALTPVILGTESAVPVLPSDTGEVLLLTNGDAGNQGAIIRVDALDADFQPVQFDVLISGVGDFLVGNIPLTRVNGARNVADRGNELVADVTIHRPIPNAADIVATVTAAAQESQQAIYTVPAGRTWAVTSLVASMRKSGGADTDVSVTLIGGAVGSVLRRVFSFGLQRSGDTTLEFTNEELQAGSSPVDLMLEVESSAADADVSARLTLRTVEI
tara:strand:+ start:1503 stop:2255 length:753 start_codon:yes stop_codon:yes gene_type:complete